MKIMSWNVNGRTQASTWDYLVNVIRPDIALLQECRKSVDLSRYPGNHGLLRDSLGEATSRGSAIYTCGLDMKKVDIDPQAEGWVIGAEITLPGMGKTLVVSVHTKTEGVDYVVPGLKVLFQAIRELAHNYDHLIVGGDLNAARSWDAKHPGEEFDHQHAPLFDWLESQWCNCSREEYGGEKQTIWTPQTKYPYQDDYIFVDRDLGNRPFKCEIPEREKVASLSDHSPVIVDFG